MSSDIEDAKLTTHQVRIYTDNISSGPNETIGTCNESGTIVRIYNKNPIPRRYIDVVKVGSGEFYRSIPPDEYLDSHPGVPVNGTYRVIHYGQGPHQPVYYLYIDVI